MVNKVVPSCPKHDLYGDADADYPKTAVPLLRNAGAPVSSVCDTLRIGIYFTNTLKNPKTKSTVDKAEIERILPYLEKELLLSKNVGAVMLMGDTANKAFSMVAEKTAGKNAVPSEST